MDGARLAGGRVYIHCRYGASRSATVALGLGRINRFLPDSLLKSAPLCLKPQCDRTLGGAGVSAVPRANTEPGRGAGVRAVGVGSGRIIASETEAPNMFVNPV